MGGLRKRLPVTHLCFFIYCLTIAGFPLTAGFFSKDEILAGAWIVSPPGWPAHYGKILWVGLMLAALGTAFYMWRLYFLVFAGKPRSEPAEKAADSPKSMTLPLVVLAALSLFAGYVGLPHLEKLHDVPKVFHGVAYWLEPAVSKTFYEGAPIQPHVSDGTLIGLMAGATLVGLVGIGLAWVFYGRGPSKRVAEMTAGPLQPFYEASKNKLWVDEFYDSILVRPFKALARGTFEILDRFVIDTVVINGSALAFSMFSRIAAWVQNGQVQRYLLGVVVGAAAVFAVTAWAHEPTFHYRESGGALELQADPGAGIAGQGCTISWDLDSDGKPDEGLAQIAYKPQSRQGLDAPPRMLAADDLERGLVRIQPGAVATRATLMLDCPLGGKQSITRTIRLADTKATGGWR
jgi:NADH-quinone oxidoreductase subunit L